MFNLMKVTAAGADFVDECPEGVVCRFFRKYDNNDNMKNYDTIKGASFLVIFSCLMFDIFEFSIFFCFRQKYYQEFKRPSWRDEFGHEVINFLKS